MPLPGIYERTLFSGFQMRFPSRYIPAPHPKAEIRPTREAIERALASGWVGQMKVHGHRAQVHLHADASVPPIVFTRQGVPHKIDLTPEIAAELRRILPLKDGWSVVDGEWIKPKKQFYLFDCLKKDGEDLAALTYPQRYALLPRNFISPHVTLLPLLPTLEKCLATLAMDSDHVEGLVFKSLNSPGFSDTSILRCRKRPGL
ncbi:hypothetical protein K2X33_03665 [bacterium]|nr:hypothetical protein [bacterium]